MLLVALKNHYHRNRLSYFSTSLSTRTQSKVPYNCTLIFHTPFGFLHLKSYIFPRSPKRHLSDLSLLTQGPYNATNSLRLPPTSTTFFKKKLPLRFTGRGLRVNLWLQSRRNRNSQISKFRVPSKTVRFYPLPRVKVSAKSFETTKQITLSQMSTAGEFS